jgi:hypothetical protein
MSFIEKIEGGLGELYTNFFLEIPGSFQKILTLFLFSVVVVLYALFVWKTYRLISRKNILALSLKKYNNLQNAFIHKVLASIIYFLENLFITPIVIFFGFVAFSLFIIFLTEGLELEKILIISSVIIASVRIICYIPIYGEKAAQEIAKLLPYTLLGVAIVRGGFLNFENLLISVGRIHTVFEDLLVYLGFLIMLEIILRFFDLIFAVSGKIDEEDSGDEINKEIERKKQGIVEE